MLCSHSIEFEVFEVSIMQCESLFDKREKADSAA